MGTGCIETIFFTYATPSFGAESRSIAVLRVNHATGVVIASEYAENPGASITNTAELLATAIVGELGIAPDHLVLFEHYPHSGSKDDPATYDRVFFHWVDGVASRPTWTPSTSAEAEAALVASDLVGAERD